jgi:hypothetical protein
MRIRTLLGIAMTALAVLTVASPALANSGDCRLIRGADTPQDSTDDVSVCRQDVFFHQGQQRLGNLSGTQADATSPGWDATKPTVAYPQGGSMYVAAAEYDIFASQDPQGRPTFTGTFTGPVDTLGFQVYLQAPFAAGSTTYPAELALVVDGVTVHDNFTTNAINIPIKTAGNFQRIDGVFTNLYDVMAADGIDMSPTAKHTVSFGLNSWTFPGDTAVFYDSSDAPSGLIFNLEPSNTQGFTAIDVAAEA